MLSVWMCDRERQIKGDYIVAIIIGIQTMAETEESSKSSGDKNF